MIRVRISNDNTVNCPVKNAVMDLEECRNCRAFVTIDKYGKSVICKAGIWLMKQKKGQRYI